MTVWVKTLWIVGRAAPQFRHRFYGSVKGTNNWYRPANLFESPVSMSAHEQIKQLEDADRCEKYDCGEKCHWLHVRPSEDEVQPCKHTERYHIYGSANGSCFRGQVPQAL